MKIIKKYSEKPHYNIRFVGFAMEDEEVSDSRVYCGKCGRPYQNTKNLNKHLNGINGKGGCKGKNTKQEETEEGKSVFVCEKCGKSFTHKSHYDDHMNNVYSCEKKEQRCFDCCKLFESERALIMHEAYCKKAPDSDIIAAYKKKVEELEQENVKQKKQIETLEKQLTAERKKATYKVKAGSINNQNNGTQHIGTQVNVAPVVVPFGTKIEPERLDSAKFLHILSGSVDNALFRAVEMIHGNPGLPEYHNIYMEDKRNKTVRVLQNVDHKGRKNWTDKPIVEAYTYLHKETAETFRATDDLLVQDGHAHLNKTQIGRLYTLEERVSEKPTPEQLERMSGLLVAFKKAHVSS